MFCCVSLQEAKAQEHAKKAAKEAEAELLARKKVAQSVVDLLSHGLIEFQTNVGKLDNGFLNDTCAVIVKNATTMIEEAQKAVFTGAAIQFTFKEARALNLEMISKSRTACYVLTSER